MERLKNQELCSPREGWYVPFFPRDPDRAAVSRGTCLRDSQILEGALIRMKIERCFEVLELDPAASAEEVRRAYRDMVAIWHPDRFASNPRLKRKAEAKLKEVNEAYGALRAHLGDGLSGREKEASRQGGGVKRDRAEVLAEAGTRMILSACSFLYRAVRSFAESGASESEGSKRG